MKEGIYFDLPEAEYHAAPGVSNSLLKDLYISPLQFWDKHINPDLPEDEETASQKFGKALHCRILEPERFEADYARKLVKDDYPDALDTMEELREYCKSNGISAARGKPETIERILEVAQPQIFDVIKAEFERENEGRIILTTNEWDDIQAAADVAEADPYVSSALDGGHSEVSIFVKRGETLLKCRIDRLTMRASVDLKSFSLLRGKQIDKAVLDTMYYEGYWVQARFYHMVRELARQRVAEGKLEIHGAPDGWADQFVAADDHSFGICFIQSSRPYHLQLWALRSVLPEFKETNVYWQAAEMRIDDMISLYQQCIKKYGDNPWRDPAKPKVLSDLDMPQLMFS